MGSKQIRKEIAAKGRQVASIEKRLEGWREQMRANANATDAANSLMQDAVRAAALADSDDGAAIAKAEAKVRAATEKADRDAAILGSMVKVAEKEAANLRAEILALNLEATKAARAFVLEALEQRRKKAESEFLAYLAINAALAQVESGSVLRQDDLYRLGEVAVGRLLKANGGIGAVGPGFVESVQSLHAEIIAEEAKQ